MHRPSPPSHAPRPIAACGTIYLSTAGKESPNLCFERRAGSSRSIHMEVEMELGVERRQLQFQIVTLAVTPGPAWIVLACLCVT